MKTMIGLVRSALVCLIGGGLIAIAAAERPLYQVSLAALREAAAAGRLTHHIRHALENVGALAVGGLGPAYATAVHRLRQTAPACQDQNAASLEVRLADGTLRRSYVQSSHNNNAADASAPAAAWPDCVAADMAAVAAAFDQVERAMVSVLVRLLGNASLEISEDGRSLSLLELPSKTHLHVYHHQAASADHQLTSQQTPHHHSLPFHVDNGLYLLLTPASALPLLVRSKAGRNIRTGQAAGPDTVLFLLGRGLTDWLLLQRDEGLTPARHAVPSLAGSGVMSRTVVARMRVAPLAAVAGTIRRGPTFGDVFLDGRVAPSVASLCYYGGPLTERQSSLRARRNAAECWPHTEKC
jgi:hypothetical protein